LARYPNIGNGSVWNGTYAWIFADEGGNETLGLYENHSDAERVASWAKIPGAMIHTFPTYDWRDTIVPVTGGGKGPCVCEIPPPAGSPRGTRPTFGPCQPAVQCATLELGYSGNVLPLARFMGLNMLQELDAQNGTAPAAVAPLIRSLSARC